MKRFALKTSAVLTLLSAAGSLSASELPNSDRRPPAAFQPSPQQQQQQKQQTSSSQPRLPQQPPSSDSSSSSLRQQALELPEATTKTFGSRTTNRRKTIVDSALLRLVSSQEEQRKRSYERRIQQQQNQQQPKQQQQQSNDQELSDNERQQFIEYQSMTSKGDADVFEYDCCADSEKPFPSSESIQTSLLDSYLSWKDASEAFRDDTWLVEYSSLRVADILLSQCRKQAPPDVVGGPSSINEVLDFDTAIEAGNCVQAVALSRISRRRWRTYVKSQRDNQVVGSTSVSSQMIDMMNGVELNGSATTITAKSDMNEMIQAIDITASSMVGSRSNVEGVVEVLMDYGLTIKDVAEILIHSPGIAFMRPVEHPSTGTDPYHLDDEVSSTSEEAIPEATSVVSSSSGETLQTTLDRVFAGLLMGPTLNLRKYDARKVVRNTPGLLTKKGSKSATDVVAVLSRLGVSTNSIARDKTSLPRLISRSPEDIFRLVSFLASDAIRMPMSNIGPLLRRNDCMKLLDAVAPVPWIERKNCGSSLSRNSRFHVMSKSEQIIHTEQNNAIYRTMSTTAWTLRNKIGTADLGKIIAAYPSVLLLDAEKQILPTADYLMHELGIWEDDLPRVLQLYPLLLGKDVNEMKKVVEYLISLEVENDSLSSIFRSFPSLLMMDVEKDMVPVVEFLAEHIGISNIGRFITRLPPVLGYSVDNELKPKWEFLEKITTDPRFEVSKFPAVFSYPLERIQNRFEYLRLIKAIPTQILSLDHVLCYGDRDFAVKVARDKDNGTGYAQFLNERKNAAMLQSRQQQRRRRQQQKSSKTNPPVVNRDRITTPTSQSQ